MRYLVLPERPENTEGWSKEELATLVTRNAMIGVEKAKSPKQVGRG
jgi:nitrile hydratase